MPNYILMEAKCEEVFSMALERALTSDNKQGGRGKDKEDKRLKIQYRI